MSTKIINIPLNQKASFERRMIAETAGRDIVREFQTEHDKAVAEYDRLRAEGWVQDAAVAVVEQHRSDLVIIMHRPDKMPMTISQEYSEGYRRLCELERDLGLDLSDDLTLVQHIDAVYQRMQQALREAEAKAAAQPYGDFNGTEEDSDAL